MLQNKGRPAVSPTPVMACGHSHVPPRALALQLQRAGGFSTVQAHGGREALPSPCCAPAVVMLQAARGREQHGTPHPVSAGMKVPPLRQLGLAMISTSR